MKSFLAFLALMAAMLPTALSQGYYPPASAVDFHTDTLTIYPPDSLPGDPTVLIGYNIYVDSVFYDDIQVSVQEDTVDYVFDLTTLLPGTREFCARSVYNAWISEPVCDTGLIIYGFELPFFEDWSSGEFETNRWITESAHWTVETESGNPAPEARFLGVPVLEDYWEVMESFGMRADSLHTGKIFLSFDIKLESYSSSGDEMLEIQVYQWTTKEWTIVDQLTNQSGSFNWIHRNMNITAFSLGKVFKVRFVAKGIQSSDITSWSVDNIHIYRTCYGPYDLTLDEEYQYNFLAWIPPEVHYFSWWLHWDDGVNFTSIGTGGAVEFDVAARWIPPQLQGYDGLPIRKISFFPTEPDATYSLRIWTDTNAANLVHVQNIVNPKIFEWNEIKLADTILLDATKELWVGYHISTTTGYPAGVDDGPAIDGYGNMMFYEGEWSTLLQVNPELDYNWNIWCLLGPDLETPDLYYNIYRQTNAGDFELIDRVYDEIIYIDTAIVLSDFYCYQTTSVWIKNGDTCESDPSNTACEIINLELDETEQEMDIRVFPVPACNWLTVETGQETERLELKNVTGERVLAITPFDRKSKIDVSGVQPGIYILRIETRSKIYHKKILII